MKKQYMLIAGLLAACIAAAGCGSKEEPEKQPEITVVPTQEPKEENLVDMQVADEKEEIKNVIGTKTDTASEVTIVNKTGGEIKAIYIRPNTDDDDEWGEDLVDGAFTLKDGDKALYYFEKNAKDEDGNTITLYDIRITYAEEDRNECFFRKLPLTTISQISLCMDGVGEDSIPYAKYFSNSSKKEVSTLEEVKERLGLTEDSSDDEEDEENDYNETPQATPEPTETPQISETPEPTETPSGGQEDDPISAAKECIGQSLDALYSACGSPNGSDYVDEPESGKTGYYYYDTFTVSTTVDENGNEVVAGVW